MKAKTQKKAKKAKVKAKKRTLTQRVTRLEKTRREALKIALDAYTSAAGGVLFAHGHYDSFEFKIVSPAAAQRLAAYETATNRGTV